MRLTSWRLADKTLPELLEVARSSGYFAVQYDRAARELHVNGSEQLRLGRMLAKNVRNRWRQSQSTTASLNQLGLAEAETSILDLNSNKLSRRFRKIEESADCAKLPFELSEEFVRKQCAGAEADIDRITVRGGESNCLARLLFTKESQAECFMNLQRQRKIWWMKITSNPGRIFATEVNQSDNIHHTSLCSKFSFGSVELEKIECISDNPTLSDKYPTIIRSTIPLESGSLAVVLDAIDSAVAGELCLDRTIAPFQCGVLCLNSEPDSGDLCDLTNYVRMLVMRAGISTYTHEDALLCADEQMQSARIAHLDTIGVPYVLMLSAHSLKEGFLHLRNRDTTLCETIHISDVPSYLVDIFGIQ